MYGLAVWLTSSMPDANCAFTVRAPLSQSKNLTKLHSPYCAGTLHGLKYLWPEQAGADWASQEEPLGQVLYDTFTEDDYHIIWDTYSYSDFSWDFGKLNSSVAKPRHSRLSPTINKVYKQQVCAQLVLSS